MDVPGAHDDHVNLLTGPIQESCHLSMKTLHQGSLFHSLGPYKPHGLGPVGADHLLCPILDALNSNVLSGEAGTNHQYFFASKLCWVSKMNIVKYFKFHELVPTCSHGSEEPAQGSQAGL